MDPSLMSWFRSPLGSLMTASRTINFQQAEISRLVSHLREQISKQNKALKKAAQQIRENSKTASELEEARKEIIGLKRELGRLSTKAPAGPHVPGNTFQSPVVVRPIPQQRSSSDTGRHFLITGAFPEGDNGRDTVQGQPTNDGFGDRGSGMDLGVNRAQPNMPLRTQPGPIRQRPLQDQTNQQPLGTDANQGVAISDRTEGMAAFKHPDILGLSPRKRARTDQDEM